MTRTSLLRASLITVALLCSGLGIVRAYAGTPDKFGNNAEIFSITITPDSLPTVTYPEITGFVRNTSSSKNGKDGKAVFDVRAVVTLPDGSQKSLLWHDVSFTAGQRKSYQYGRNYDIKQPGVYKVVYSVHDSGKKHLYTSLSKSFTVISPAVTTQPATPSGTAAKASEAAPAAQLKKEPAPETANKPDIQARQIVAPQPQQPSTPARPAGTGTGRERIYFGIGGEVNTINFSGGPSLIFWPLENIAVQASYGLGTFTSYEARVFYRFPLSRRLNPYFGAGYLHAERKATIIGVDTKITGDSFTAFGGVELPVYKKFRVYLDISGTPMKLKKDVISTTQEATGVVKYSPLTINAGFMLYLF